MSYNATFPDSQRNRLFLKGLDLMRDSRMTRIEPIRGKDQFRLRECPEGERHWPGDS